METKLKEHDLNLAEMKAGQLQLQSEVQAMRTDLTQNFASLRKDMGLGQGQSTAPQHPFNPSSFASASFQQPAENNRGPRMAGRKTLD